MSKIYEIEGCKTMRCPECNHLMKFVDDGEGGYFLCVHCYQVEIPEECGFWQVKPRKKRIYGNKRIK